LSGLSGSPNGIVPFHEGLAATVPDVSVDENGDENGLRGEISQSSTVLVAVIVNRSISLSTCTGFCTDYDALMDTAIPPYRPVFKHIRAGSHLWVILI
jgi:hypothetical protein